LKISRFQAQKSAIKIGGFSVCTTIVPFAEKILDLYHRIMVGEKDRKF
jgi:hypothetical protein